jgi:hypothetical protein
MAYLAAREPIAGVAARSGLPRLGHYQSGQTIATLPAWIALDRPGHEFRTAALRERPANQAATGTA